MLIEAESTDFPRPNALCLRGISDQPSSLKTLEHVGKEAEDLKQGSEPVTAEKLDQVSKDLASNPPLKFDLARVVRTFNAQFQFVEFEVTGLQLNRMTVPIPSDLMGHARDEQTQKLLHSTFKLVRDNCEVSGEKIVQAKKKIAEKYLVSLKGFGSGCLRVNKDRFLEEVQRLRAEIEDFQKQVAESLQGEMDANRRRLAEALLPAVVENPPNRWTKFVGPQPSLPAIRECLDLDLASAFRSADDLIRDMKVSVVFKDVTYESLTDPKFGEVARKALPHLIKALHEEGLAAEGRIGVGVI